MLSHAIVYEGPGKCNGVLYRPLLLETLRPPTRISSPQGSHTDMYTCLKFMSHRSFTGLSLFGVNFIFSQLDQCHLLSGVIRLRSFPDLPLSAWENCCLHVGLSQVCRRQCLCVCVCLCAECVSGGQWEWWVCKRVTSSGLNIAPPSSPRLSLSRGSVEIPTQLFWSDLHKQTLLDCHWQPKGQPPQPSQRSALFQRNFSNARAPVVEGELSRRAVTAGRSRSRSQSWNR